MIIGIITIGIWILLPVLIIALQIFLSKRESKWLGLILPGICIVCSLLTVIGMISFIGVTKQGKITREDGRVIEKVVDEEKDGELINRAMVVFGVSNVPTLVLMGIYFGCREKRKKNLQLEKMNIQDLE